jgi:RimJ/RimL family protein N-acetyltransferase
VSDDPVIVTERLELWRPRLADLRPLFAVVSHPQTGAFLGPAVEWVDHYNRFHRNAGGWYLHGYGNFIARLRGEDKIAGTLGVFHSNRGLGEDFDMMPEAGWILAHDQVGKGLASEAMTATFEWFEREHGAQRIVCMISPGNQPSLRMAEKFGFTPMRDAVLPDGEPIRLFERLP